MAYDPAHNISDLMSKVIKLTGAKSSISPAAVPALLTVSGLPRKISTSSEHAVDSEHVTGERAATRTRPRRLSTPTCILRRHPYQRSRRNPKPLRRARRGGLTSQVMSLLQEIMDEVLGDRVRELCGLECVRAPGSPLRLCYRAAGVIKASVAKRK
ncbi:hypothetical protein EDB83DRAFT_2525239 [Lactarius deliciosus]|nr:hypothetical protein EDB83DRAFT_2525239 [Lactarius deliciosus]